MDNALEFARGPLFRFCFAVMILGLARVVFYTVWGMRKAIKKAGDKNIPYFNLIKETLGWVIPLKSITSSRWLFSSISFLFHVGLIIIPLFYLEHILLWKRGVGISWPNINKTVADVLTLVTIATGIFLLFNRIFHQVSRVLSKGLDYTLLLLILCIFTTGYVASRPYNPIPYTTTMFIHVLCGNALFVLIPFTKLAHCLLFPLLRIASNIAWHFPARAGEEVNMTLYGEEIRKI
jgi:nitrate reductase gamma subunit